MFEKWETYSYPNTDAKALHTHAFQWWIGAGFRVAETAAGQFNAVSSSKWGLQREATVTVRDQDGTATVDLRVRANVTTEGVVGGGLALVLLWPVAVVGGAYSYAKYEQDARDLMTAFWTSLGAVAHTTPTDHKEEVVATTAVSQEEVQAASQPPIASTILSNEDKLSLLEDRLARGEISEETYHAIKARLDE
jgi:hypothetical protein